MPLEAPRACDRRRRRSLRAILHQFPVHGAISDRCCIQHTTTDHASTKVRFLNHGSEWTVNACGRVDCSTMTPMLPACMPAPAGWSWPSATASAWPAGPRDGGAGAGAANAGAGAARRWRRQSCSPACVNSSVTSRCLRLPASVVRSALASLRCPAASRTRRRPVRQGARVPACYPAGDEAAERVVTGDELVSHAMKATRRRQRELCRPQETTRAIIITH